MHFIVDFYVTQVVSETYEIISVSESALAAAFGESNAKVHKTWKLKHINIKFVAVGKTGY